MLKQDNLPEFLSRKQAAELLSCSDQLISKYIKTKKLRAYKLGRLVRIKRADLLSTMDAWYPSESKARRVQ